MGVLDAERWQEIASHLDRALEMTSEERATWLNSVLEEDPRLGAELRTLLREHQALEDEGFLEAPPASLFGPFARRREDSPGAAEGPRYAVGEEHARGGMGRILLATDTYLQRTVAIKELLFEDPRAEARFLREAKLTARLEHPAVVPVHDAGRWQASGKLFYSMKLVKGRPLHELVSAASSARDRLGLVSNVLAVAEAVAYAHSEKVIHRDLKPSNVLVGAYGETLVVDWGLAKDLTVQDDDDLGGDVPRDRAPGMTVAGTVLGTPNFMPPEQARGADVDERADVYAIGAMLYFVLVGRPPYEARDADAVLEQVVSQAPPRIAARAPATPSDLCSIVDKAMAREPSDRYANGGELAADLRRFLTGQLVAARVYSWRELVARWTKRHRAIAGLSVVFVMAAIVGTGTFVRREQRLRTVAEASRARADGESQALLIEHGKRELSLGRPSRAAVYLAEAYRHDPASRPLQYMVTEAVRPLGAHAKTLLGHNREVVAVAFSSDGARLATGSTDRTVRLWDVTSGETTRVLEGPESSIEDVAWSPDGKLVASAERGICVWNALSGELLKKLPRPGYRLSFSRDGKWLAVGAMNGSFYVWDTATWELKVDQKPYHDRISAIAFHPDGERVVTTSWDGVVTFWSLPTWTATKTLTDHHNDVSTASFSADGHWLLTGDRNVTLFVREARTGDVVRVVHLPEGSRWMSAFFGPDGRSIVTGSADGAIRVWHTTSGALLYAIDVVPDGKLFDTALSPDGVTVATAGLAGADLWRLDQVGGYRVIGGTRHDTTAVYPAAYSADGTKLAVSIELAGGAGSLFGVWDAASGAELASWQDPEDGYALAASPDLSRVAAGGVSLRLWNGKTGQLIARLEHGPRWARAVAFNRDGTLLASGDDQKNVRIWRAEDGTQAEPPIAFEERLTAVAFSPKEPRLAVSDASGALHIQDLERHQRVLDIKAHPTWIEAIAYSADGEWLVTAGRQDHTAKVWNAHTGNLRSTLTGHVNNLIRAAFSPDATLVSTVSVDDTARIWDPSSGEMLRMIRGPAYSAQFSPDGRELLTTGLHDYTVFWDATLDPRGPEEIARLVAARSPWQLRDGRLSLRDAAPQPAASAH